MMLSAQTEQTIARLEEIHDSLYVRAQIILKSKKPCGHKKVGGVHSCIGMVEGGEDNRPGCCCFGCPHLDPKKGCIAEKPLTCRTWLCEIARGANPETSAQLRIISQQASDLGFWICRGTKWEEIEQAAGCFGVPRDAVKAFREQKEAYIDAATSR